MPLQSLDKLSDYHAATTANGPGGVVAEWLSGTRAKIVVATAGVVLLVLFSNAFPSSTATLRKKSSVPWGTNLCDAVTGDCYEHADKPSPRTGYSAWSEQQFLDWTGAQRKLAGKAEKRCGKGSTPPSLLLIGDSITESWLGTGLAKPVAKFKDTAGAFARTKLAEQFGSDPLILGLSGDQTQHVLWRLEQGHEMPKCSNDEAFLVIMLIGTNNLGNGHLPGETVRGIVAVANKVLTIAPKAVVLMSALMPRGDGARRPDRMEKICPPRCKSDGTPFASFTPAVNQVNEALPTEVSWLQKKYGKDRVALEDCSRVLVKPGAINSNGDWAQEVDPTLMPDYLHPNAEGMVRWADCMAITAGKLMHKESAQPKKDIL